MSLSNAETDIILNKANIALARSQRLVASWLPQPPTDDPEHTPDHNAAIQREEDEIFVAVPERYIFFVSFSLQFPYGSAVQVMANPFIFLMKTDSVSARPCLQKLQTGAGTQRS